jgi:hypothetical protein
MKTTLLLFTLLFSSIVIHGQSCVDTTIYANAKQTKYDNRFSSYKKIKSQPKYSGGPKKFEKYLRAHLVVDPRFKNEIFNLNYQIVISCEGEIIEAKTMGDKRFGEITNFIQIAHKTAGEWKPAKKNGESVNCIYFGRLFVNGSLYQE